MAQLWTPVELVSLAIKMFSPNYGHRKVWREGLEVAIKLKQSQGKKRVEWIKPDHPYTAISPNAEVHTNHNEAHWHCLETTM